jgi:hypothetical protein
MKICLWVFKIRGFEGGIGVPKRGGPLNSTRAGLLNHQTSKTSVKSFWMKICLWVYKIRGFEGGIGPPTHEGPQYSTVAPVSNHQASNFNHSNSRSQYFWWVFRIQALKVELDLQRMGALIIPPRPRFQITKHLNLDILVLECYLLRSLKYKRT